MRFRNRDPDRMLTLRHALLHGIPRLCFLPDRHLYATQQTVPFSTTFTACSIGTASQNSSAA